MIGLVQVYQGVNVDWGAWMESQRTNSNVMADKMRVEFPFYHALSQLESNTDLFQFRGQELDRFSVKVHQADTCGLEAHLDKILLHIQDRCVKIPLGRRICTRDRVRSCCVKKERSEPVYTVDKHTCILMSEA